MGDIREFYAALLEENPQLKFVSLERGLLEEIVEDFGKAEARIRELEAEVYAVREASDNWRECSEDWRERAEKAKADNARLRQQLEHERHQADLWYDEAKRGTYG